MIFSQVGKANGLTLLLDAETYEYSSHAAGAEGFKVAVDHHLDQPLMSISELDITPGFESQGRDCNSDRTQATLAHMVQIGVTLTLSNELTALQ